MAQDSKQDQIIEAAKKRFIHFGVAKTTMNEIADDLGISKASLYYYFPDKLNLYAAVLSQIIEVEDIRRNVFEDHLDPETAIFNYLDNRIRFINKYYNILEYIQSSNAQNSQELKPVFTRVRSRQLETLHRIIMSGKNKGLLHTPHPESTAELFLDCLEGLRAGMMAQQNEFFPGKKIFQAILKREKALASIFLKGLRP